MKKLKNMKKVVSLSTSILLLSIPLFAMPEGAIQLIGEEGISNLVSIKTGGRLDWPFKDGVLTVKLPARRGFASHNDPEERVFLS